MPASRKERSGFTPVSESDEEVEEEEKEEKEVESGGEELLSAESMISLAMVAARMPVIRRSLLLIRTEQTAWLY